MNLASTEDNNSGFHQTVSETTVIFPDRAKCTYTANYCEENIWKLCEYVKENYPDDLEQCFCVFISNDNKKIPLWKQKAHENSEQPVIWDYHVIFVFCDVNGSTGVYDLDTTLPFPCDFRLYITDAIRSDTNRNPCYRRKFRVISAKEYLNTFASDRSHMKNSDGIWMSQPPSYPCIHTSLSTNNIDDFISMDPNRGFGTVMNCTEFFKYFTRN